MKSSLKTVFLGTLLSVLFCSGRASSQQTVPKPSVSVDQQKRLELMKSKNTEASLTILPIRLAGKPFDRVTEFVGLLLEQQGLRNIDLGKIAFEPVTNATFPYVRKLAALGWKAACRDDAALRHGLNIVGGKVVYPAVAEAFGLPLADVGSVL